MQLIRASCIFFICFSTSNVWAVETFQRDTVYTSKIKTFRDIWTETSFCIDTSNQPLFWNPPLSVYHKDSAYYANFLPSENAFVNHYLRFILHNDEADTVKLYFYADTQESVWLKEEDLIAHTVRELPVEDYKGRIYSGTQTFLLTLLPEQTLAYTVKIIPLKTRHSAISPALIRPEYVAELFLGEYKYGIADLLQFTIFWGMLLMMLLYIFFKYLQVRSIEYLYYSGYILFFLFYFLYRGNALNLAPVQRMPFFVYYWGSITQFIANCFYFAFFRRFLTVSQVLPRLDKILRWATAVLIAYICIDFVLFLFPKTYFFRWFLWDIIRASLIILSVVALFIIVQLRNRLMWYIFTGSLAMAFWGLLAMVLSYYPGTIENLPMPFRSPLFYFQLGITIELLCFALGLGYKNKRDEIERAEAQEALKIEQTQKEFEKYKAAVEAREAERKRIASEMHDDIGSGLTSILFLSNAMHQNVQNGQSALTEKISLMASGLVDQMSNIIWSMNKEYDTLQDLIAYTRSHISELLENAEVNYVFHVQESLPEISLNGVQRRNIYLVIKEAVHNAIKHAEASQVVVDFRYDDSLKITIQDDGKGFVKGETRKYGNGMKNMQQRMKDIEGGITWDTEAETGTRVCLEILLSIPFSR
ncbi:sensor histidine kinase [Xanthocytophaga flava]|uniref:sensor histidine kinase n=1 Tax=Xanthocytophaga flava TaxID=3048013 RepID=UPI0028D0DB24|nr:7TM diverse intracellular signaling domain-containing protein [Xanthocytophaga flavus]MDJ1466468.1 7TM diverse intracellular signaling domain-containing protein [Xanthocytophaga flavus]